MRYKLPEGVSAITAGTMHFEADETGHIDVAEDVPAEVHSKLCDPFHHGLSPAADLPVADDSLAEDGIIDEPGAAKPVRRKR